MLHCPAPFAALTDFVANPVKGRYPQEQPMQPNPSGNPAFRPPSHDTMPYVPPDGTWGSGHSNPNDPAHPQETYVPPPSDRQLHPSYRDDSINAPFIRVVTASPTTESTLTTMSGSASHGDSVSRQHPGRGPITVPDAYSSTSDSESSTNPSEIPPLVSSRIQGTSISGPGELSP